ncbi:hypothetical protein F3Y22_tig00116962pilonHSYRG00477 [Hibiscus syriacus]|uniref:Uncharacterized protein n=1 Tax=Hibiscus syriacus TaxID=106335 RepID=A0A6A2XY39_HIBSY|nr:hypothetical protein F3Y22_tig00116962pilonHSYRG00477 [Hibiscus syriacus]
MSTRFPVNVFKPDFNYTTEDIVPMYTRLYFNFTMNDIQFKAQLHNEGASQFHSEPISTSRRRILDSKQHILILDFNFTMKDIQFKAQLHNEGAIHDFHFTTNDIVPSAA